MTPELANVYDALIALAADARFADLVGPIRAAFERRVGPFSPADVWFEERSAALWDRVLTDRAVLERMLDDLPANQVVLASLARTQRGLFEVHAARDDVDLVCVATGAAFRLSRLDDAGRALATGHRGEDVAPGLIDGRVIATREGSSVLPGMLVHAAEATAQITDVVARARALGLADDDLFDALLSMRHRLASLSRMKPKQVYRAELLDARE